LARGETEGKSTTTFPIMKNKTKLTRTMRQPRRFPAATTAHHPQPKPENHRHDFLVLSYYPGMPAKPETPIAA
jgi:hypothetical protein